MDAVILKKEMIGNLKAKFFAAQSSYMPEEEEQLRSLAAIIILNLDRFLPASAVEELPFTTAYLINEAESILSSYLESEIDEILDTLNTITKNYPNGGPEAADELDALTLKFKRDRATLPLDL
ncbi:MAG: hypothetical protein ABIB11_01965 [Candidatus Omnitrophota bacterium]